MHKQLLLALSLILLCASCKKEDENAQTSWEGTYQMQSASTVFYKDGKVVNTKLSDFATYPSRITLTQDSATQYYRDQRLYSYAIRQEGDTLRLL